MCVCVCVCVCVCGQREREGETVGLRQQVATQVELLETATGVSRFQERLNPPRPDFITVEVQGDERGQALSLAERGSKGGRPCIADGIEIEQQLLPVGMCVGVSAVCV